MGRNPLDGSPPDDTGTETFRRYRYQAYLAVPFCLNCAAGEGVISIIMEHLEDVVVQYEDSWLFIQVKTRNANLGPWRLTDAMDGLESLYRIFKETRHLNATYALYLEGPIDPKNALGELVSNEASYSEAIITKVSKALKIEDAECEQFLAMVVVRPEQPPREYVENRNLDILGGYAPRLSRIEMKTVHERVMAQLEAAMARDRVMSLMPGYIGNPNALPEEEKLKVEAKRLTYSALAPLLESVVSGSYLLRSSGPYRTGLTNLEKKLVAGGADANTISSAKTLRANATMRETELLSATLYDTGKIEDVRVRLQVFATGTVSKHGAEDAPANQAWADLLINLPAQAAFLDQNRVYHRDPMLLLGAICGMSDECLVHWGGSIA